MLHVHGLGQLSQQLIHSWYLTTKSDQGPVSRMVLATMYRVADNCLIQASVQIAPVHSEHQTPLSSSLFAPCGQCSGTEQLSERHAQL